MTSGRPQILFVLEWLPAYRIEFLAALRQRLLEGGMDLTVVHGSPSDKVAQRQDAASLPEAIYRSSRIVRIGRRQLVWQPWRDFAEQADLVVVNEGSRLLLNYWLLIRCANVAFWGHGANLDELNASRTVELVKRWVYRLPEWWFAYTEGSRRRVVNTGFPSERVTVVQNTIFSETLSNEVRETSEQGVAALRAELGIGSGPVGLFLGSLYPTKRVEFLLAATDQIAAGRSDFSLVVAGDGPQRDEVASEVAKRRYAHFIGRAEGARKAALLKMADTLLLPGAVGLNVLDGFAASVPVVSTSVPTHGPEIEYLDSGVNGIIAPADSSPRQYAEVVLRLLSNSDQLSALTRGAAQSGARYTGREMVERFAQGIEAALAHRERSLSGKGYIAGTARGFG